MNILYYVPESYTKDSVPYRLIAHNDNAKISSSITSSIKKYLLNRIKKPGYDIVHIFGGNKELYRLEAILQRVFKSPLIVHILAQEDSYALEDAPQIIEKRLKSVIFQDPEIIKNLEIDKKIPAYAILPGTTIDHYYPQVLKQLSMKKEIISYCDFSPECKLHVLIEAMRYLPAQFFLTCLGHKQDEAYFMQVKEMAENLGVKLKVELITDFDEALLEDKYSNANLFITVSKKYSSVMNAYKSLFYGTISVCPQPEYDITGLVDLESLAPRIIAKQIKELTESDILVNLNAAKETLGWKAKALELQYVYESIAQIN